MCVGGGIRNVKFCQAFFCLFSCVVVSASSPRVHFVSISYPFISMNMAETTCTKKITSPDG